MKSKAETEIDFVRHILTATADDFRQIERWWPKARRGVNAQRALDSLARRIETALQCTADARAALSAADAIGAEDGWRPIETAPKDGTRILGFGPHDLDGHYIGDVYWWEPGSCWPIAYMHGYGEPTHWRPLPPAPAHGDGS